VSERCCTSSCEGSCICVALATTRISRSSASDLELQARHTHSRNSDMIFSSPATYRPYSAQRCPFSARSLCLTDFPQNGICLLAVTRGYSCYNEGVLKNKTVSRLSHGTHVVHSTDERLASDSRVRYKLWKHGEYDDG